LRDCGWRGAGNVPGCARTDGDDRVDWNEIAGIVENAFRTVAPKALIAELDER
jgi:hypothetical protein